MSDTGVAPPDELRFRRRNRLVDALREVWDARQLTRALAEREIRAAYKQAALGVAWAIVTPVTLMIVFTIFFQRVADIDTGGAPYPLFSYVALVPWNFFATSVASGGLAVVSQMALVNKIRCPREAFPLASMSVAAFNSVISVGVLVVLFVIERTMPKPTTVWIVLPLAVQLLFTTACVLLVSSVTVYLRDLRHAIPILLQLGLFATPIAYSLSFIPENLRSLYCLVNPLGGVIDSYRQAILYGNPPNWALLGPAALTSVVLFYASVKVFRRLELGFADVA